MTTGLGLTLDLAIGAAMLVAPWLVALLVAAVTGKRLRRRAAEAADVRETDGGAALRVLRGSVGAGLVLGAWLALIALVPTAASPAASVAYARSWWPLIAADVISCLAAGVTIVAAGRGALSVPPADDPAHAAVSELLHAAQDDRDEAALRRRRAATARREAARHRRLSYSLDAMDDMDGEEFEQLCGDYFASLGYTVDFTPQSGDGGIDLVLSRDGELSVAQCKRTRKSVGEPIVRDLYGALHHTGAVEAFLCASSGFSPAARTWAQGKAITLVDGEEIVSSLRRRR